MKGIPVLLLCGGQGIWVDGSGARVVKPLVRVGSIPMVLHVIHQYRAFGATSFVLAGGLQHDALAALFSERAIRGSEFAYTLEDRRGEYGVTVLNTGEGTPTGDRLRQAIPHLPPSATVALHYSDVLGTVDLAELLRFHREHGKLATVVGARIPIRFRVVGVRAGETTVRGFSPRPVVMSSWINGGYYLLQREALDQPWVDDTVHALEDDYLQRIAAAGQLEMFPFEGSWQYLDGERNLGALADIAKDLDA